MNDYKIILTGELGVGKTAFIDKFKAVTTGALPIDLWRRDLYCPTLGVDIAPVALGADMFYVWDMSGAVNGEPYYANARGAIIMYSEEEGKKKDFERWEGPLRRIAGDIVILRVLRDADFVQTFVTLKSMF